MRHVAKFAAAMGVVALVAAGCGRPDNATSPSGGGSASGGGASVKACMVLDTGGVDDKSFNQSSWAGMQAAKKDNPNLDISYVASNSSNDYTPNLTQETNAGCDTVLAVGGLMAANVEKIAKANPKVHYAEIDNPSTGDNVYGIQYNTAQGGFLGGYLAAAMTKTGVVGTWGGLNIGPVTIYMDGFWEGVQYFNKQNNKSVKVLGWDENKPKGGTFAGSFTDQNKGKQITLAMAQQGADIVFPVAGSSGLGAGAAAASSGGKLNLIWVDTDGCVSAAQYCKYFISSVTKGLTASVQDYLKQVSAGTFPSGNYVGTLQNDGTGLAPFHDWDSKVPADVKSALTQITSDIESGKIKITSPSQPK
ncbi:BMP family protein [Nocardioides sp. DS6]|uniref:BMP family protein n=1 Tax=Nocardioides eburneus TaxID=3231482 RepID=A0ABV3T2E1_9ACTN